MTDPGTDSTGRTLPQAEAPVSLYLLPTSRNEAYPNTSLILHLGTMLEHGDTMLLDFPPQQIRDKKGSRLSPVAVVSNAGAEHPPH